ncbi:MAG: hypothetical protein JNK05_26025 [Myxococcales bacterium]|nr:hypothetical protein [Myxococcales bacterium]
MNQSPSGKFELELRPLLFGRRRLQGCVRRTADRSIVVEIERGFHSFPFLWTTVGGRDLLLCSVDKSPLAYVDPYTGTVTKSAIDSQSVIEGFVSFGFDLLPPGGLVAVTGAIPVSPGEIAIVASSFCADSTPDQLLLFDFSFSEYEGASAQHSCVWTRVAHPKALELFRGRVERIGETWLEEGDAPDEVPFERVGWIDATT